MTGAEFRRIRQKLGLSLKGCARFLRMREQSYRTIQRWETGDNDIPGPVQVLFEALDAGQLPDLESWRRPDPAD